MTQAFRQVLSTSCPATLRSDSKLSLIPASTEYTFTGSTAVGSEIMRLAALFIKKVALELGGKNACIIFSDADLRRAAASAAASGFGNAGQSCSARSRILVQRTVVREFVELFGEAAAKFTSVR